MSLSGAGRDSLVEGKGVVGLLGSREPEFVGGTKQVGHLGSDGQRMVRGKQT